MKVAQSCLALSDPMDYTVHGILQARILEWVSFPFSRGFSNLGIKPRSPALQTDSSPAEPPRKPHTYLNLQLLFSVSLSVVIFVHCVPNYKSRRSGSQFSYSLRCPGTLDSVLPLEDSQEREHGRERGRERGRGLSGGTLQGKEELHSRGV